VGGDRGAGAQPVTEWLLAWGRGDDSARERLLAVLYNELHRRAVAFMQHERKGHTLQPTALVNEVYLRLVDQSRVAWKNRSQFLGVAAQMMRRILVDHARSHKALKRDAGVRVTLDGAEGPAARDRQVDLLELDLALQELAAFDPGHARLVELRYFAGLTIEEAADVLEMSPATLKREWAAARAWLFGRLHG
jgi:RNA polymerase sigma factor (TIGR02999 family)